MVPAFEELSVPFRLFPDFRAVVFAFFFEVPLFVVLLPEDFREPLLFKELPPALEELPLKEPLALNLEPLPLKEPLLFVLKDPLFPFKEPFPLLLSVPNWCHPRYYYLH